MNDTDLDLRGHVGRLLGGSMPLDDFRHWFANALWDLEEAADDDTLAYAYLIENRIAEQSGGHISSDELLAALREDAREVGIASATVAAAAPLRNQRSEGKAQGSALTKNRVVRSWRVGEWIGDAPVTAAGV